MRAALRTTGTAWLVLWGLVAWSWRYRTWAVSTAVLAFALYVLERTSIAVAVITLGWAMPAVVAVAWSRWFPYSFEEWVAGPWRRRCWRVWARKQWPVLSRNCGLSTSSQGKRRSIWSGNVTSVTRWSDARLCTVSTAGYTISLLIRARPGQTSGDIVHAADAIASAAGAVAVTARVHTPSTASVELVMADYLAGTVDTPDPALTDTTRPVVLGRAENSGPVTLDPVAGLHVAIQGATRSGKSALCYGYLSALAYRDDVLVCGVDPTGILLIPFVAGRGSAWIATTGTDAQAVADALEAITAQMDDRIAGLVRDGRDKVSTFTPTLPAVVVVLEEYPGLLSQLVKDDEANGRKTTARIAPKVERAAGRIIKEGAKVGVTVLVLAQRMSAKAIETDDRSNLPVRITLRVDNGDAVAMLHDGIDRSGLDVLRQFPPGRGLIEAPGLPLQKFQADYTDYDTYRARVAAGIAATDVPGTFVASFAPELSVVEGDAADGTRDTGWGKAS